MIKDYDYLFTSESVSEGHPDKVADQISDGILDYFLAQNPYARVAVEAMVTTNKVVLAGEIKGVELRKDEIENIVRNLVKGIGYNREGFDWQKLSIDNYIHGQSADIAMGVDENDNKEEGAGDQGIMFGYACNETDVLMPYAIHYSHKILETLSKKRRSGDLDALLPDAKAQVTIAYKDRKPLRIHTVVVSHQHVDSLLQDELKKIVMEVLKEVLPDNLYFPDNCTHHINPTGRFVIGGPDGDTGLTGRKIIVDTYGGSCPHGGGAFSGKDPTKVDRSAAYIARYLAKNIVASGIADRCTIQLSYAIGIAEPLSVYLNFHKTGKVEEIKVVDFIGSNVSLSPKGIRTRLGLNKPIYQRTASYGHFGRDHQGDYFTWERLDLVDSLKKLLG